MVHYLSAPHMPSQLISLTLHHERAVIACQHFVDPVHLVNLAVQFLKRSFITEASGEDLQAIDRLEPLLNI